MRTLLSILIIALLTATLPLASAADEFYYEISGPGVVTGPCNYVDQIASGQFTWYLDGYFVFDQPTSSVRFAVPDEYVTDRVCPGAIQTALSFNYPWSGDPAVAVEVNFGGCVTGVVHVFTRSVQINDDCPLGSIFGPRYPTPLAPTSTGCDAVERIVEDVAMCTAPPTNLMPADGATDISINPTMTCAWASPTHCPEGIGLTVFSVFLGTDPDNLEFAGWQDYGEVIVGPLQPYTTYYWRMRVVDDYWLCPGSEVAWSPIMSFTTAAPIATEERSWGSVKADYRGNE
jgi:hypothetical protein